MTSCCGSRAHTSADTVRVVERPIFVIVAININNWIPTLKLVYAKFTQRQPSENFEPPGNSFYFCEASTILAPTHVTQSCERSQRNVYFCSWNCCQDCRWQKFRSLVLEKRGLVRLSGELLRKRREGTRCWAHPQNEALSSFLLASFVLDGFAEFRFRRKTFFLMLMMTRVMGVERRVRGAKTPWFRSLIFCY